MDGLTQLSENELKNEIQKIKEKMEKKDSKKLEFSFLVLFSIISDEHKPSSSNEKFQKLYGRIVHLTSLVILNSDKVRKVALSKDKRKSLIKALDENSNKLLDELIESTKISSESFAILLEIFHRYLITISSATLSKAETTLAKSAGVDLEARKIQAITSARRISDLFPEIVLTAETQAKEPTCNSLSSTLRYSAR